MSASLNQFFFAVYPYICLAVFFMGSLARFDRDQYTWKSDSSQLLRAGQLRWGSNLFHIGILFLLFGHTVGLLTPHWLYSPFISAGQKQLVAVFSGGTAGLVCFIGLSLLLHRRIFDPRIRLTSHRTDLGTKVKSDATLIRVETDTGLVGIGAALGSPPIVAAVVAHELAPECVGEDPMFSERIYEKMYNGSRAKPALERGVPQPDESRRRGMAMEAIAGVRSEVHTS